jgi:hypothetical protein
MFVPGLRQLLTLHEANLVRAWKTSVYNFGGLGIIEARGRVILFWNARSCIGIDRGACRIVGAPFYFTDPDR